MDDEEKEDRESLLALAKMWNNGDKKMRLRLLGIQYALDNRIDLDKKRILNENTINEIIKHESMSEQFWPRRE